ncbi:MAG: two-component sensor histidine kinase [Chloroflexi bacterium]|nr:MAG: two-component sensor histidine kinase [Chloroflexota bacterium]
MKRIQAIIRIVATGGFFVLLYATFTIGAYFLTAWIYRVVGHVPPPYLIQVINSLLGGVALGMVSFAIAVLIGARPGRRNMGVFEPIFAAMEQIARGDFQVSLSSTSYRANVFASLLAQSVTQMAEELSQMEHLRQDFISNVSHEIQSPLTSIRGFARLLRSDELEVSEQLHYLSIIEAESMRLSRMTDSMLKLATLETLEAPGERKLYRLDKQIRAQILACEPEWAAKSLELEVAVPEIEIVASEDLLSQVWSNLLHNSIKFTPRGGKITVEAHANEAGIDCGISDTGIGIPEESQPRIFERFYKVDQSRERSNAGSGLGLSIAKKIVELHQGTIKVHSQLGVGTTVIVALPGTAEH